MKTSSKQFVVTPWITFLRADYVGHRITEKDNFWGTKTYQVVILLQGNLPYVITCDTFKVVQETYNTITKSIINS